VGGTETREDQFFYGPDALATQTAPDGWRGRSGPSVIRHLPVPRAGEITTFRGAGIPGRDA
jgi:hypothetical protein